jgi:hypothetical protein
VYVIKTARELCIHPGIVRPPNVNNLDLPLGRKVKEKLAEYPGSPVMRLTRWGEGGNDQDPSRSRHG